MVIDVNIGTVKCISGHTGRGVEDVLVKGKDAKMGIAPQNGRHYGRKVTEPGVLRQQKSVKVKSVVPRGKPITVDTSVLKNVDLLGLAIWCGIAIIRSINVCFVFILY